jgi:hypothetical protein
MTKGAFAASGAGGVLGLLGLGLLIAHGPGKASGWIFVAGGCLVLLLAQFWSVQRAIEEREEAKRSGASVTGIGIGPGANVKGLTAVGNVMSVGSSPPSRRGIMVFRRGRRRLPNPEKRQALSVRGDELAKRIADYAARQAMSEPPHRFPPRGLSQEDESKWREAQDEERENHRKATAANYQKEFVSEIAVWLDEVEPLNIPQPQGLAFYGSLAGAHPLVEISSSISVLAARVEKYEAPWWRRLTSRGN